MTPAVFLSASIPLPPPHRSATYFETADTIAIRDSVRALVSVVIPKGKLVFGGHPAITPMVRMLVRGMKVNVRDHVVLYQSEFFRSDLPSEVREFEKVHMIPSVRNDRDLSLARMRETMIKSEDFQAGVFIGGMEGVEEEYQLFKKFHPGRTLVPVASTGAAALALFNKYQGNERELLDNLLYLSLFHKHLNL